MEKQIHRIKSILSDQFEHELFEASLNCLNDIHSKLRFNNFAYSIRELSRHFLHRLSPDENVKACSWFKKETENGQPTRAQRIKYAIQGGIEDNLLILLGIDVKEFQRSAKSIKISIDSLSRYTHINPEVFDLDNLEVEARSKGVICDFETFVQAMISCRRQVMKLLEGKIEEEAIGAVVSASFENIDSLAPHYSLDAGYVENYSVEEINESEIVVIVEGEINVTLSWGSNSERRDGDGHDVEDSFPFSTRVRYFIGEDFPNDSPEVDEPGVDTSKWDIDPDDEYLL
ncbi:hypothetical protein HDF26_004514 [Pedobacter cryoconitis]|uniref:pPIWI-associating nuclease domain-containing protein n=1 Tax=Pedobacter cryoconitis TaxID=188932 RepID=UPI00161645CA|nr:hypothetical protein [Pedobacter cryoconitis]MBB6274041.1 hypothetical protein [Pedobacter cryoconitis]